MIFGRLTTQNGDFRLEQVHNGSLWVTYSVNKEDIEVMRVPLGQLVTKAAGTASQSGLQSSAAARLKTDEAIVTADCPKQGFP